MPANRPPDRASYGSHLPTKQFDKAKQNQDDYLAKMSGPRKPPPHEGPSSGGQPAKKPKGPKGPKKPKDPNLNPNMAVPFGRR